MHPNPAFAWTDEGEMLAFIDEHPFATIALPAPGVLHAPLIVRNSSIEFHVARRNRLADSIDDRPIVASVLGRHGYQSANWYVGEHEVPTWHYEAVEVEGVAQRLDEKALAAQVGALVERMEQHYVPDRPWSQSRMKPGAFEAMLESIVGFRVPITAICGTRKFNQHKSDADAAAAVAGLRGAGMGDVAQAVLDMRP